MSHKNILTTIHWNDIPGLFLIELNRPKVMNALNTETLSEIISSIEENKDSIKCVLIKGNKKAFSAGADIKQLAQSNSIDHLNDEREILWKKFRLFPFPIIAGVSGYCLGGGHELAMACDMTIACENAVFGQPEVKLGIMPGAGGTQRLTKALGKSKAMYYTLTGKNFNAREAYEFGLVAQVIPTQTLDQELTQIGKTICSHSPTANRLIKESVNKSFESSLVDGLDFERRQFYLTFASQDAKEGMNAFIEKRKPEYKGN